MYLGFYEEGDRCPEVGCKGTLKYGEVKNCSCHINPPCSKCVDNPLICDICDFEDDAPSYRDVSVTPTILGEPGILMREYKPRQLDKSKIDYRSKLHSNSSMIKEGVYPQGTTQSEVEAVVKGTFGGRFESFLNGKFRYIAYTD